MSTERSKEQEPEPRALAVVRAHPWAALLSAAAAGFLVARLVRRPR